MTRPRRLSSVRRRWPEYSTRPFMHVVTEPLHEPWTGFVPARCFIDTVERLRNEARQRIEATIRPDDRVIVATAWGSDASDEILKYATSHQVDLVVCGTHGRQGWNRLL